jgi:hypothetical protein
MTTCLREITNIELIKKKSLMEDDVLVGLMLKYKREEVEEEKRLEAAEAKANAHKNKT